MKTLRNRLRVISMAEEKQTKIRTIISSVTESDHLVVYCGDGRMYDDSTGEELRHIQSIKRVLSEFDYKASQFTATENMQERMQLVDSFNKGEISALAAIRCLDEGINIPSIKSALILSSNDDYREFVQRNCAEKVMLPKHIKKKAYRTQKIDVTKTLTLEQVVKLIDASKGTPVYMQILFASLMGLRRGEINGLKYSDVDYINRTLKVQRQLGKLPNSYIDDVPLKMLTKQEINMVNSLF